MERSELTRSAAGFQRLCELVEVLRGPGGCPWDREQTPATTLRHLLEEVYELADAVEGGEPEAVCEESGDVLFLLLFLVHLHRQKGHFGIGRVLQTVHDKMVRRHPHVFGGAEVENTESVRHNWTKIKQGEKREGPPGSILDAVPRSAPALMRAYKTASRIAGQGLDPRTPGAVFSGAEQAMRSCRTALQREDREAAGVAFGELLLRLASAARSIGIHPETVLSDALGSFENRFRRIEREINAAGRRLDQCTPADRGRIAGCLEGGAIPKGDGDGEVQQ